MLIRSQLKSSTTTSTTTVATEIGVPPSSNSRRSMNSFTTIHDLQLKLSTRVPLAARGRRGYTGGVDLITDPASSKDT